MRKTSLALAMAAFPFVAAAAKEDVVLPDVNVTAQAIDHTSLTTDDSGNLLRQFSGVSVYSAGGVSGLPVINGLADDRIKVRIDGMEITSACGNHMNPATSYIDPTKIGSLQVLTGVTLVSAGGDSIAGSINISSRSPIFAAPGQGLRKEGNVSIAGRSVDNGLTTSLDGTIATDSLSFGYNGSVAHADSYKDGKGNKVRDTLYESRNQTFTLAARGDGNLWVLRAGEQEIPYQGFPNQYMDMTGNHTVFTNLNYTGDFSWGTLEAKAYWQDTRHKMGFFSAEKTGSMPMDTHGRDIGYSLKADIPLATEKTLRIGNEYHQTSLDDWWPPVAGSSMMGPNNYVNINNGKRDRFVVFAELEGRLAAQWTGLLGLRHETVSTDAGRVQDYGCGMMCATDAAAAASFNNRGRSKRDNNLDLTALARYEPDNTAQYEFGYARKTRSPNLYERYTWGKGNMAMSMIGWYGDGNGYVGNIDLKPEVAHTVSGSVDWHDAGKQAWQLKANPYYSYIQDFIDADFIGTFTNNGRTQNKLQFANHDAHLYGLNLSGWASLWRSSGYGDGVLRGKLDWARGKRNDGGDLYHIMPLNLSLSLEQQLAAWTNTLEVQGVAAKTTVDTNRLENKTGGYSLVNVGTRYQWNKDLSLQAGIRNLFDRYYTLPLGGLNISMNQPLLGQGRSIDLGVSLKF